MMSRRSLLAALAVPVLSPISDAVAGDDALENKPAVYARLFPKPTGTNGYEEIVYAGELVQAIQGEYHRRVNGKVPLAKRRECLAHPASREAASLLRRGIAKPITVAEQDPFDEDSYAPYALLRALARLLSDEIYVSLADGRTDVAVRIASEGLTFTHPFKSVSVVFSLVARAMDAIVLAPLVRQRDGWSVRDCRSLIRLSEQWLAVPDPATAALTAERASMLRTVGRWREKPDEWAELLVKQHTPYTDGESETEGKSETAELRRARDFAWSLRTDGALRERVLWEMTDAIRSHFDRAEALIRDPTGRMVLTPAANNGDHYMLPFLRQTFLPEARVTLQRSIEGRVNLQLLAVHAGIRAYRWENDRLPKSLDQLELAANLIMDPFTRKPLVYEPESDESGYELASAGALFPGKDGKPDARERITLPWTLPK